MQRKKSRVVNRFAAAAESNKGRVYSDNGQQYSLQKDYPFRLNFYLKPPPMEITVEEFETFALDRLQVLRAIDTASLRNRDIAQETNKTVEEYLPLRSNVSKADTLYEERRKDHVSHYVLRMAYCRSDELREWFVRQECELFKHRFEQESHDEKKRFLEYLNLNWKMLSNEKKEELRQELEICSKPKKHTGAQDYISSETFFEVDFEKVPLMVASRGVYVKKGKAYVPMTEQVNIVMLEYKTYLQRALESISKLLPQLEEDDRIRPILLNVEKQYIGFNYNDGPASTGTVTASEVDNLVQRHAPLCMRNLSDNLKHDRHLKHDGRLQYGLFIKGMGLAVEEALIYWRTAFSNTAPDKFSKDYAYNIRYNYGLEGKRTNYSPYSCSKIITGNPPSATDNHGCPFRHFSTSNLEARLLRDNISRTHVDQILTLARDRHYQLACTKHYEVTHPEDKTRMDAITHPNQYYEASRSLDDPEEKTEQMDESI